MKIVKQRSIADSVHNYIDIPDEFYTKLIDTAEFQRLRRLAQLGGVPISYPSATHSRFSHSLGAFHIANKILAVLQKSNGKWITEQDIKDVRVASLIHDVGHGPFSHMFEDTIRMLTEQGGDYAKYHDFLRHENITQQIVLSDTSEIGSVLEKKEIDKERIADLIIGKPVSNKPFLNQIIASQLDADSIDYLMRDSLVTGVSFGLYNIERLLAMLKISSDGRLVIKEKGMQSTEQIVIARYMQFSRVYFHKTVRCWEYMIKLYISQLFQWAEKDPNLEVLKMIKEFVEQPNWKTMQPLTDDVIFTQLQLSAYKEKEEHVMKDLAKRILQRKLFKSIPLTEEMVKKIKQQKNEIDELVSKCGFPEAYWGIDVFYSRYYTPYTEVNRDAILIELEAGEIKQLSEVSEVVSSLSRPKYNNLLIFPAKCRNEISKIVEKIS